MNQRQKMKESGLEVTHAVKSTLMFFLLFCSLCLVLPVANAQTGAFDLSIGFGTVHDKSNGLGLDYNDLSSCTIQNDSECSTTASHLSGLMMGFDGNYMVTKRYGVGADVTFQPAKQNYVSFNAINPGESIQSRMTFYDFNGIVRPVQTKHASLQFIGGFGGANLRFYDNLAGSSVLGNTNSSEFLSSANHAQLHAGVAAPIYIKDHFFVRPEFDIHYVHSLNQQYNSDLVTQGMVWVGYTFGGR